MSMRPDEPRPLCRTGGLAAIRHRTTCVARWLGLPGAAGTPDCLSIRYWHRSASPFDGGRAPVLLVHGYAGTEHMWHPLRAALGDAGFDQIVALRYNTFRADIHDVADWLVEQARRTVAACGSSGVHLIGHSMGGLVVRDAVLSRGLGELARTAITLATPHHGSHLARFAPGPGARQMLPGSSFLRDLAARGRHGPARWIDIQAEGDRVVAVGDRSCLPDPVRVRTGHRSIVRHPDVVARIVAELVRAHDRQPRQTVAQQFSLAA